MNEDGQVVHPDAPQGGGGPGFFRTCGPLGCDVDVHGSMPEPHSPVGRYLARNESHRKRITQRHFMRRPINLPSGDPALNAKVKSDADASVGNPVVGSGECYDLVDALLAKAGAKSAPDFGKITANANYEWGTKIRLDDVKGGDVLQFRNHKITIVTVRVTRRTKPDRSWRETTETTTETHVRPHHTAVVSSNNRDGTLTVIEQHVKDPDTGELSSVIRQNTLYVHDRKSPPVEESRQEGDITVDEKTTVKITVSGKIWAYRPQTQ